MQTLIVLWNLVNPWRLEGPPLRSAVVAHSCPPFDRRKGSGPRPRAARRYRLPHHDPIHSRSSCLLWSYMDWSDPAGFVGCGDPLLCSHVGHHSRIPPLLQSPVLQDQPSNAVLYCVLRSNICSTWRNLVGSSPSAPPPALRHPRRCSLSRSLRLLVLALRLDLQPEKLEAQCRNCPRSHAIPRACNPQQDELCTRVPARLRRVVVGWLAHACSRLLLEYCCCLPRYVCYQLPG